MKTKSSALSSFCNPRVLAAFVIGLAGLTLGFFAFVANAAPPVVITVNTLLDEATPGDGLCSLREAITNAIVHGNKEDDTKQVELSLSCAQRAVEIQVKDQGEGFDPGTVPDPTSPR